LALEDAQGNTLLINFAAPANAVNGRRLLFNRYDEQYFLAAIVLPEGKAKLSPSNSEKQLARNQSTPIKTMSVNMTGANK
jgi:hypothetical protein